MKKFNNTSQTLSNVLNAKNLALVEVHAMDTLYMW